MDGALVFCQLTQGCWKIASKGPQDPFAHIALKKGSLEYNVNARELKQLTRQPPRAEVRKQQTADCVWNRIYITSESQLCGAAGLAVIRPGPSLP